MPVQNGRYLKNLASVNLGSSIITRQPVMDELKQRFPATVELGITAIELMPVHQFVQDHHLVQRGLSNYWGYNTLSFFAPAIGYASSKRPEDAVREF